MVELNQISKSLWEIPKHGKMNVSGVIFASDTLLQKIKVMGIDKDKDAVTGAKQNLEWFGFQKEDYTLFNSDSRKAEIGLVSGIATEPDLGDTLKKIPTKNKAKQTISNFEKLIVEVIKNLKEKISGRIAFTSPNIRIGKKRIHLNLENVLNETGYVLKYEIPEFRENQIVGRMIYVLEK